MGNIDTLWRSSSFDNFVTNLPYIMLKGMEETPPDMVRSLFTQKAWNPVQGDRVSFDAYSLPQFAQRSTGENSAAVNLSVGEGDTMTVRQQEYSARFMYTHRMDTFDKEKVAEQFTNTIVGALNRTIDLEMTHKILSDAEDSTYTPRGLNSTVDWTCANGQPLASASQTAGGVTFSTEYTTAGSLCTDTLTAMEEQARSGNGAASKMHVNHLGEPIDIDMDTLIIPKNNYMIKKAFEIFGTPIDPGTNLNAVNIFKTQWNKKIVVLNLATRTATGTGTRTADTDLYRYALMDSRYLPNFQYQMSDSPKIQLKDTDIDTVLKVILGMSYCAFATVQPQGYMIHRQNVARPSIVD